MSSKSYPVLPLRNSVFFPGTAVTLEVGRGKSVSVIDLAEQGLTESFVLLSQKDVRVSDPGKEDLYTVGTRAKLLRVLDKTERAWTVVVQGLERVILTSLEDTEGEVLKGTFIPFESKNENYDKEFKELRDLVTEFITSSHQMPLESKEAFEKITDAVSFCDLIAGSFSDISVQDAQKLLENPSIKSRISFLIEILSNSLIKVEKNSLIQDKIKEEMARSQREYLLRQELKTIKKELGDDNELDELESKVAATRLPDHVKKAVDKQLRRLSSMQSTSSEFNVTYNYIETVLDVPWIKESKETLSLDKAKKTLDQDHYGLEAVKKRVLEFLAVRSLNKGQNSPIICLAGPPGTGKTSISTSIAKALGREFVRVSLGGIQDESEIRGHRRTYVGAMPGRIAKAMISAGTTNPVILLDEIDKVSKDYKGDPQAALLEVLDPEQNCTFSDHYVEIPLDLSKVLFIATANDLDRISGPLRDRMEIIEVPSYTSFEKKQIVKDHFLPKQVKNHGIKKSHIEITDEAIDKVISSYTREAGVRSLERRIADLCRNVAVQVANTKSRERNKIHVVFDEDKVSDVLGPERFHSEIAQRVSVPGVATGLAWTQSGGDILFIESSVMKGTGQLKLTGQLGDVMKESAQAALSFIKSDPLRYGLSEDFLENKDLHIHFPAGAIPKDGPSAGITIFSAIISILTGVPVKHDVAMSGEITLRGTVLPVGGVKEKVTAAHRAGIKTILLPKLCKKDLVDLAPEIKDSIEFHFVERAEELPSLVFVGELPSVSLSEPESLEEISIVN